MKLEPPLAGRGDIDGITDGAINPMPCERSVRMHTDETPSTIVTLMRAEPTLSPCATGSMAAKAITDDDSDVVGTLPSKATTREQAAVRSEDIKIISSACTRSDPANETSRRAKPCSRQSNKQKLLNVKPRDTDTSVMCDVFMRGTLRGRSQLRRTNLLAIPSTCCLYVDCKASHDSGQICNFVDVTESWLTAVCRGGSCDPNDQVSPLL